MAEVRQLRKDLQSTNGSALKAQILLSRLQDQEGAVARLSQHLEDVRSKLADTQDPSEAAGSRYEAERRTSRQH